MLSAVHHKLAATSRSFFVIDLLLSVLGCVLLAVW